MHCTFRPNVQHGGGKSKRHLPEDYKPIHERMHKVLQEKSLRLASMRMSQEMGDPDLTFAPKINSKSAKLAHMKAVREELSTIDRLASGMVTTADLSCGSSAGTGGAGSGPSSSSAAAVAAAGKQVAFASASALAETPSASSKGKGKAEAVGCFSEVDACQVVPREYADCTFSPQISKKSKEILRKSQVWNPDFYKRQEQFVEHKERHLSEGKRSEDPDCTFTPDIGNARDFLSQQANRHLRESRQEHVTRLSSRDAEEKRIREESLRESHYAQFKFKPKLSERSKQIAPATDLNELVYNEKGEKIRRSIAKEVEDEFNAKCTFKPQPATQQPERRSGSSSGDSGPRRQRPGGYKESVVPVANLQIAGDSDTVIQRIENYRQEKELRIREYVE